MSARSAARLLALAAIVPTVASVMSVTGAAQAEYQPPTELVGDGPKATPLKDQALIEKTDGGFRYKAGQQDSHLTVSIVDDKVVYVDTGTQSWRHMPRRCTALSVPQGVSASCTIPARWNSPNTMYLEVWPRLGDDYVDGSTLPSWTRLWVLGDRGRDTVYAGAGDDFVNGAQDADTVYGGGGNDWLRTGLDDDVIWGEDGNDRLVGVDGHDVIHGGPGDDQVGGGASDDTLYGDAGTDKINCGTGADDAFGDLPDRMNACESVTRS